MKNKGTALLLSITLMFFLLTLGFLVGRNVNNSKTVISYDIGTAETQETELVSVVGGKININTASVTTLCELPGIGETIAGRIIAFREEHGNFINITDLMQVEGIGDKTFRSIADLITVGD